MSVSIEYAKTYYPALLETADAFTYQESLRIDAASGWNSDRALRGWTALDAIRATNKSGLPAKFIEFIDAQVGSAPEETKTNNVRRIVKAVWTWPLASYLPWIPIKQEVAAPVCEAANNILRELAPKLALVEGKIYLMLPGFIAAMWKRSPNLGELIPGLTNSLAPNTEAGHITVVNSDMVQDQAAVGEWLADKGMGKLAATKVQHTISLDWAPFSACMVVEIECEGLVAFIAAYNTEFGTKARVPSAHVTVAVSPRMPEPKKIGQNIKLPLILDRNIVALFSRLWQLPV